MRPEMLNIHPNNPLLLLDAPASSGAGLGVHAESDLAFKSNVS
jgi:hypothetical protein